MKSTASNSTPTASVRSPVSEICLLPAHEFPTDCRRNLSARFREEIEANPAQAAVYQAVSSAFRRGVEYLSAAFEEDCATLFDYIGENAVAVCIGDVHAEAARFWGVM